MGRSSRYYTAMPAGELTQGDIWTCMPPLHAGIGHAKGLIITPRCDLAHRKTNLINYLSVITLRQYIAKFTTPIVLERLKAKFKQQLIQTADALGFKAAVEIGLAASELRMLASTSGKPPKLIASFCQLLDKTEELEKKAVDNSPSDDPFVKKERLRLALEVAKNNISDAHFMPAYPPLLTEPSVVLFRAVGTCSAEFLIKASQLVTTKRWEQHCQSVASTEFSCLSKPEPLLRLKSPYLESLVFRYVGLFARVGVQEVDESVLNELATAIEDAE